MRIFIIGAGFTGQQLARRLIAEKNDVVLIDNNEETARHVSNRLDCMVIHGSGNSLATLNDAGLSKAHALVAVTSSDEINMIICSMVDSLYPKIIKIARVRNYNYYLDEEPSHNLEQRPIYGIDHMIHPDMEAATAIVNAVKHGGVTKGVLFENSNYQLTTICIEKNSKLDQVAIHQLRKMIDCNFILAFISTEHSCSLPSGNTILQAGDEIALLIEKEDLPAFLSLAGKKTEPIKNIVLLGAGRIGTRIAEQLIAKEKSSFLSNIFKSQSKISHHFLIIEKDKTLAIEAENKFPQASVYNADVTDEGFVAEERLDKFDLIIAATRNHELNMVSSAYLKSLGAKKTICLVTSGSYADIAQKLGIDVAIPIRDAVIDCILSHLRGKNVTEFHTISDGELEIIEFEIPKTSKKIGKSIKDVASPGSFLILLIEKNGSYEIPVGDTILEAENKLVFIMHAKARNHILHVFGATK
ncbi:MAG: Trk system potassium transporter TrkA [Treponemataceae bacterium]